MKTEVRKEHGDWIVFVDDNPQFSFMYREEAEKVRNMVDALFDIYDICEPGLESGEVFTSEFAQKITTAKQALLDAGADI